MAIDDYEWLSIQRLIPNESLQSFLIGELNKVTALDDLRQTRVFQEIRDEYLQEGKQEGEYNLVIRLIKRKFGTPDRELTTKIANLPLEQLESLGEELLDFKTIGDLIHWLDSLNVGNNPSYLQN